MRLSHAVTVGALLSLALVLLSCGGEPSAGSGGATTARSGAEATTGQVAAIRCGSQLRSFLDSMEALREDLAVGLSYEAYLGELRGARDAYDRIPADRLAVGCLLLVAGLGERALNRYIDAANAWGDCLATAACEIEAIEPELQRRWARASDLLSSAQSRL
jgi:hypothetical protein